MRPLRRDFASRAAGRADCRTLAGGRARSRAVWQRPLEAPRLDRGPWGVIERRSACPRRAGYVALDDVWWLCSSRPALTSQICNRWQLSRFDGSRPHAIFEGRRRDRVPHPRSALVRIVTPWTSLVTPKQRRPPGSRVAAVTIQPGSCSASAVHASRAPSARWVAALARRRSRGRREAQCPPSLPLTAARPRCSSQERCSQSGGGGGPVDAAVWSSVIVAVEPPRELVQALVVGAVGAGVGPFVL